MLRTTVCAIVVLSLSNVIANAQSVNLSCRGTAYLSSGTTGRGSPPSTNLVGPAATVVDIDNRKITTPLGEYTISKVDETTVYFEDHRLWAVDGHLDRISGEMHINWYQPAEWAKAKQQADDILAGRKVTPKAVDVAMLAELHCSAAKRLF
jgi:hypothetical protein